MLSKEFSQTSPCGTAVGLAWACVFIAAIVDLALRPCTLFEHLIAWILVIASQ
jgi:hypothetical protein